MATRQILADLASSYEQWAGRSPSIIPMGGVDAARLIRAGGPVDVVVLASNVMAQLEREGHLVSGESAAFARSGMAVAVRSGALRPSIADEGSVKRATLEAHKICYSTGPSGDHLKQLWERWGIGDAVAQRAIQAPPGVPVGEIVARGQADLGFQQLSELLHLPGIDIVGPLPPEIQTLTIFSAGVGRASSHIEEAREFVSYLTSIDAEAAIRRHGMEPA